MSGSEGAKYTQMNPSQDQAQKQEQNQTQGQVKNQTRNQAQNQVQNQTQNQIQNQPLNQPGIRTGQRDVSLDVIRIAAFVLVPSVHFFLQSEYYDTPICGTRMCLMTVVLSFCMTCVPLFLLLTGFLESQRRIALTRDSLLRFYSKLIGIFCVYLIATALIVLFRCTYLGEQLGGRGILDAALGFRHYSWYVEMYLGLALLIPFLNVLWNGIREQTAHRALLVILCFLTMLPGILDIIGLDFTPGWWKEMYPLTYYFIGAYLQRYDHAGQTKACSAQRGNSVRILLMLLGCVLLISAYSIRRSDRMVLASGDWNGWGGLMYTAETVLLFRLLRSLDYSWIGERGRKALQRLASLTFAAYLLSWIPDHISYPRLIQSVSPMELRFSWFLPVVLISIVTSLLLAAVVVPVADQCSRILRHWLGKVLHVD